MQKWEYLHLSVRSEQLQSAPSINGVEVTDWKKGPRTLYEYMQKFGDEGWELVAIGYLGLVYVFKRPKP